MSGGEETIFFLFLWANRLAMRKFCQIMLWLALLGLADGEVAAQAPVSPQTAAATVREEVGKTALEAYDNRVKVSNAPEGSQIEVFSVVGIKVRAIRVTRPDGEYVLDLPKGYYIVRLGDVVSKIVIR